METKGIDAVALSVEDNRSVVDAGRGSGRQTAAGARRAAQGRSRAVAAIPVFGAAAVRVAFAAEFAGGGAAPRALALLRACL
jgi:hypothetical protein